ncbi:subtilisin-like protease [Mycena alexandri]|uniref:Subtilisin-like protease n=1 Tax=Mycena alexandri TaxID=1745969 RepID=A0AAD6TJ38_9AGAR|nr:subtilisin-like protease [Mycena alexandri]
MKATLSWLVLFLGGTIISQSEVLASKSSLSDVKRVTNLGTVSNKFIVELSEASEIPSKRALGTQHEELYRFLRKRKITFDVHKEYDAPGIFIGAALTLADSQDVTDILKLDGVVAIRPVRTYTPPKPISSRPVSPGDAGLPDSEATHITTGVDRLHAQGITGKGIKIGIIDSGVDYTHPSLGSGFGPGFKIEGGFDFVGDNYTGDNTPVPDSDPLDQCFGHGTHVAGIIGANPGNEFNISGVAYTATIYAYRVFSCQGLTSDDIILEALLMGVKDGMDVLTMSIGGPDGWTTATVMVVSSRIAASGKIVTIAADNNGASGSWFSSRPGNAIDGISVASSDNTALPLQTLTVEGVEHAPIFYYDTFPLPINGTLPLYATSNDTTVADDACNPLPASTPDLSKFVVLVRRGTCVFATKLANIAAFGAKTALFYDNGIGFASIQVGNFTAALIQAQDGVFLGQHLAAGEAISVTFPQSGGVAQYPLPNGGLVSAFTSYGPTNDFYFKPSITAPGGNILSTFPVPLGSWIVDSGTSMAAPFMAGSAALLLAVQGRTTSVAKTARTFFQATAKPISSSFTNGSPFQTVTQQGAGLVQVYDAIFSTTLLSHTELVLNDSTHFAGLQRFTVTNTGKTGKVYTLSHLPAGTAVTVTPDTIFPALGPVPLLTQYATVSFDTAEFTLLPGHSHEVVATVQPPSGVNTTTFPVYSGFIYVTSGNESVHATYIGLAASLKDKQVIDNTDFVFGVPLPALLDSFGNFQDGPLNYTLVGDDAPTVLWRQAFGTPVLRLDLVTADTTLVGALNPRTPISFTNSHAGGSFAKVQILGPLLEMDYLNRNDEGAFLDNTFVLSNVFANGSGIPIDASCRVLLRSLRVTGDPANEADYESWLSPIIGVVA